MFLVGSGMLWAIFGLVGLENFFEFSRGKWIHKWHMAKYGEMKDHINLRGKTGCSDFSVKNKGHKWEI